MRPDDLHRPMVDELTRPNPDDPTGRSTMRRVPETLDCWFESGSMPFAQVHYPFENAEWFEHHYPGDFIVEYIGQTRGWFYTLHVLATALFDRPSFSTCMAHGIVLGSDGQKMSKSLRNYPDPYEMFDTYGSDAMRWFLMSSAILRGSDLVVTEQGIRDAVRQVVLPLWNAWYFFSLYANAEQYEARFRSDAEGTLDRYLLAKVHDLVADATTQMDAYDLFGATATIRSFLDVLTNWYIRRSRDRFWDGDADAFDTLYTALDVLTRVAAPLLPLVTEEIYRGLTGERSVHLTDWPTRRGAAGRRDAGRGHGRGARGRARRRSRCARPGDCGCGSRWRRSPWPCRRRPPRPLRRPHRRRGERAPGRADRRLGGDGLLHPAGGAGGLRAAPRWRDPEGDPRHQAGRLDARRRHGRRGRHRAARG